MSSPASDIQRDVYKRVARLMLEQFADRVEATAGSTILTVAVGSTSVDVEVKPWRDDALIVVSAVLITGARLEHGLYDFLLHESRQVDMGGFSVGARGEVIFSHTILGSTCDRRDLRASVWCVMNVADQYDDRIQQSWGGKRAVDHAVNQRTQAAPVAGTVDQTAQFSDKLLRR